jgi:hypothetical protein
MSNLYSLFVRRGLSSLFTLPDVRRSLLPRVDSLISHIWQTQLINCTSEHVSTCPLYYLAMKPSVCIFFQSFIFQIFSRNKRIVFWNPQHNDCNLRYSSYSFSETESFTRPSADLLLETIYRDFPRCDMSIFSSRLINRMCPNPSAFYSFGYHRFFPSR